MLGIERIAEKLFSRQNSLGGLPLELQGSHARYTKKRNIILAYILRHSELLYLGMDEIYRSFLAEARPDVKARFDFESQTNKKSFIKVIEEHRDYCAARLGPSTAAQITKILPLLSSEEEYAKSFMVDERGDGRNNAENTKNE